MRKVHFEEGAVVQVGETLVTIETSDDDEDDEDGAEPAAPAAPAAAASDEWTEADEDDSPHKILASPAVRALAREHQLDLRRVVATGPKGRVTKGDVMAYLDSLQASGPTTVAAEVTEGLRTTEADSIPAQSRPQTAPAPVSPQAPPPAAARGWGVICCAGSWTRSWPQASVSGSSRSVSPITRPSRSTSRWATTS